MITNFLKKTFTLALVLSSAYIVCQEAVAPLQELLHSLTPEAAFDQLVHSTAKFTLVKFFMNECGPCKRMKPIFSKVAQELTGKVQCIEVDIDKFGSVANKAHVQSVPTFVYYAHGKEQGRIVGIKTGTELKNKARHYFHM
ncbi:thioredoxin family protein [Candidatus Dependentiae bacterium]|nr:thioredoxin family protein [Candidatus Dependentiae bacterium]